MDVLDNKYQVEQLLGQGGMGAVYRATYLGTKRTVAVKVIIRNSRLTINSWRDSDVRQKLPVACVILTWLTLTLSESRKNNFASISQCRATRFSPSC